MTKAKLSAKDLLNLAQSKKDKSGKALNEKLALPDPAALNKKINHGKVVNYYVEYEDGTALLAQGDHAHLIYRFTLEAQKLATMHAFAYYEGPGMKEYSKELAIKLIEGDKDENSK